MQRVSFILDFIVFKITEIYQIEQTKINETLKYYRIKKNIGNCQIKKRKKEIGTGVGVASLLTLIIFCQAERPEKQLLNVIYWRFLKKKSSFSSQQFNHFVTRPNKNEFDKSETIIQDEQGLIASSDSARKQRFQRLREFFSDFVTSEAQFQK